MNNVLLGIGVVILVIVVAAVWEAIRKAGTYRPLADTRPKDSPRLKAARSAQPFEIKGQKDK